MSDVTSPALEVRDLVKAYDGGQTRALDGASLAIGRGEWVALTGPSGCGKSTLLHMIAALDRPTSGEILIDGRSIATHRSLDHYRRHEVGLVFQFHNLLPHLSARENVAMAMIGSGTGVAAQRGRADDLLASVGLATKAGKRPPKLSGGERQRVAIARALANAPAILLADEPTGALDSASTALVLDLFRKVQREHGVAILMVTHDAAVAEAADRIIRMRDGRVVLPVEAS